MVVIEVSVMVCGCGSGGSGDGDGGVCKQASVLVCVCMFKLRTFFYLSAASVFICFTIYMCLLYVYVHNSFTLSQKCQTGWLSWLRAVLRRGLCQTQQIHKAMWDDGWEAISRLQITMNTGMTTVHGANLNHSELIVSSG